MTDESLTHFPALDESLCRICNDILGIIEESLIPNSTSEEAKVYVV